MMFGSRVRTVKQICVCAPTPPKNVSYFNQLLYRLNRCNHPSHFLFCFLQKQNKTKQFHFQYRSQKKVEHFCCPFVSSTFFHQYNLILTGPFHSWRKYHQKQTMGVCAPMCVCVCVCAARSEPTPPPGGMIVSKQLEQKKVRCGFFFFSSSSRSRVHLHNHSKYFHGNYLLLKLMRWGEERERKMGCHTFPFPSLSSLGPLLFVGRLGECPRSTFCCC